MTTKRIAECDGPTSEECHETIPYNGSLPDDWGELTVDGNDYHFCPTCIARARGLLTGGRSVGTKLKVQHKNIGYDFEHAHVAAGTHGIQVQPVIDEPPETYPDYDHDSMEAWHISVHDHLHVNIFGAHKQTPAVVVQSDEFPTALVVDDREDSFTRDVDFPIESPGAGGATDE